MLDEFDFTPVLKTAVSEVGVPTHEKAEELMDAFLQWFSIIPMVDEGESIQMLRSVDRIWHAFILNTRLYREFCDRYIGHYIDHDPTDVEDDTLPKEQYAAFTLKLLHQEFGDKVQPALELLAEGATCCGQTSCRHRTETKEECRTRTDVLIPNRQEAAQLIGI